MHVLGMPPAFVLSQDQTLKLCHILSKHGDNPADLLGMSFKEPIPALSNVMDTNEHASSQPDCGAWKDVAIGFNISGYRGLEFLGPGAVAHMSLHQKLTMSKSHQTKEADSEGVPRFW